MEDRDLALLAAADGSEEAFATLFKRHSPALRRFISRKLGFRYQLTDDIALETWAHAFQGLSEFRGECSFRVWVHTIALNRIKSWIRALHAKKRTEVFDPDMLRSIASGEERIHLRIEFERVFANLPERAARTLWLREVMGLSHREIAEEMGVSVGTAKSQLNRGKKLARQALGE